MAVRSKLDHNDCHEQIEELGRGRTRYSELRNAGRRLRGLCRAFSITNLCGFAAGGAAVILLTIAASSNTPYNIFTAAGSPTYPAAVALKVTGSAVQGSNTTATAAIDTGSAWAAGSTITITVDAGSKIHGMGGAAGNGGDYPNDGAVGLAGGHALNLQWPITIINNGEIGGGGGGGGGGGADGSGIHHCAGGGGGGGRGGVGGARGNLGAGNANISTAGSNGTAGSDSAAGVRGNGAKWNPCPGAFAGDGGDGGDLGLAGVHGGGSSNFTNNGGIPGAGGNAIKRNGNALSGKADGTYSDANWKGTIG